jgi:hypothetical protein
MTGDISTDPPKYQTGGYANQCNTLSLGPDYMYVCTGVRGGGPGYTYRKFTRSVSIQSLSTLYGGADYSDDLRVTSTISFRRPSGFIRQIQFVDFLHARS